MNEVSIVLLGASGTGKTALFRRFFNLPYSPFINSSLGIDFDTKEISGAPFKIKVWDTAGQERYNCVNFTFFRKAQGVLLTFDLGNPESFKKLDYWLLLIEQNCFPRPEMFLVGTKLDQHRSRIIEYTTALCFAQRNQMSYIECSAITGENVPELFSEISWRVYDKISDEIQQERAKLLSNNSITGNCISCFY